MLPILPSRVCFNVIIGTTVSNKTKDKIKMYSCYKIHSQNKRCFANIISVSMEKHWKITGKGPVAPLRFDVMTAVFTTPPNSLKLATETLTTPCRLS